MKSFTLALLIPLVFSTLTVKVSPVKTKGTFSPSKNSAFSPVKKKWENEENKKLSKVLRTISRESNGLRRTPTQNSRYTPQNEPRRPRSSGSIRPKSIELGDKKLARKIALSELREEINLALSRINPNRLEAGYKEEKFEGEVYKACCYAQERISKEKEIIKKDKRNIEFFFFYEAKIDFSHYHEALQRILKLSKKLLMSDLIRAQVEELINKTIEDISAHLNILNNCDDPNQESFDD